MIQGIDVSSYQSRIDWQRVAHAGIQFAFIKLSEGIGHIDALGCRNVAGARAAGLRVGGYHFLTTQDPAAQAALFIAQWGEAGLTPDDMPPVLDLERGPSGAPSGQAALAWLRAVEDVLGVKPAVYTGPAYGAEKRLGDVPELSQYGLWVAHWQAKQPAVPAPWAEWSYWQTGTGTVAGIAGQVDLDVMQS